MNFLLKMKKGSIPYLTYDHNLTLQHENEAKRFGGKIPLPISFV